MAHVKVKELVAAAYAAGPEHSAVGYVSCSAETGEKLT
jgi:hypothetical protein